MIFKFFLIFGIVAYLLYKIGSFFYRIGAASQNIRQFQEQQKKNFNSANKSADKSKKESKINGGEYIDYEEVK